MEHDRVRVRLEQVEHLVVAPLPHVLRMRYLSVMRAGENEDTTGSNMRNRGGNYLLRHVEVLEDLAHGYDVELAFDLGELRLHVETAVVDPERNVTFGVPRDCVR